MAIFEFIFIFAIFATTAIKNKTFFERANLTNNYVVFSTNINDTHYFYFTKMGIEPDS